MKEEKINELFKEEMKGFEINVDDIQPNNELFNTIEKAIIKMRNEYFIDRLEVVLNDNLIETKDKYTGYRTILGCRVSYDNLPKDVSFIVRKDIMPTYEQLEQRKDKAIEYIKENQYQHEWTDRGGFLCTDDRYILNDSQDVINILEGKDE